VVYERFAALLGDPPTACQVVHGDLSGNVHVDRSGTPVVLDFSPYLRPREWAAAIVIADAVLWNGAPLSLARSFASTRPGRDLLARALIFRIVADQLATTDRTDRRHGAHLDPYRRVLAALPEDR
jgi:fructosamine-3-kinase